MTLHLFQFCHGSGICSPVIHQRQLGVELCFQLVHSVFEGHIHSSVTPITLVIMRFQIDMNWITFMVGQMIIHVVWLTACVLFAAVYWGVVLMLGDLIGA